MTVLTTIEQVFKDQLLILNNEKIVTEDNRRGLRLQTGKLLETAYIDLVSRLNPALSIEIGAHEATYSQCVKQNLPNTHVLAFEANPFVYRQYVDKFSEDIEYNNLAISDANGEIDLYIPISLNGTKIEKTNLISSLLSRTHKGFEYETIQVPAQTLDTVSKYLDVEGAVAWVDAEGAQEKIITGGEYFFSQVSALYLELEHEVVWQGQRVAFDVIKTLAALGLEPLMADNLASGQYNAVFLRMDERNTSHAEATALSYLNGLNLLL